MYRHAIVNKENKVINVIIWDGSSSWQPPKDHQIIKDNNADVGDRYDPVNKKFNKP